MVLETYILISKLNMGENVFDMYGKIVNTEEVLLKFLKILK